jgi:integrase
MPARWSSRGSVLIRLARQHFAFYRGYLDGLDLRLLVERYPGGEPVLSDKALASSSGKALLGWITEQLVIEAERCGQRSAARLLRLRPFQRTSADDHGTLPTLAEFQEERDPYHMYSEGELLELFELEYPGRAGKADRLAQRSRRLRRRQEALLQLIESHARLEPSLDDPVSAWIDSGLANYLIRSHITTLGGLHATIEAHGFHWYRKVPRIGVKAARHITSWLLLPATREALGLTLSVRGTTPPRLIQSGRMESVARRLDIVPMERLALPVYLNGVKGTNRGATGSISAKNDIEAIEAWLLKMRPGSHTARACRKEAERFLLWCVLEAEKPFSSAHAAEVQSYLQFLSQLGKESPQAWMREHRLPQERWLGPRGIDRWSVRWRPFEGPLSMSSQRAAISLLKSLMRFLHSAGYLRTDPFAELRISVDQTSDRGVGKHRRKPVLQDEWAAAWTFLESQPISASLQRVKVILLMLKETGCRLQRLASMRRDSIVWDGRHWCLKLNPGDAMNQEILLSQGLGEALLMNYRHHGFPELDSVPPSTPLVTTITKDVGSGGKVNGLSGSRIYKIVKDYFYKVADHVGPNNIDLATRLRQISADSFSRSS